MIWKCLITEEFHPLLSDSLVKAGIEIDYQPLLNTEGVSKIIGDYHIIIVNSKILLNRALLGKAFKLKIIGRIGSGLEIIDLEYAKNKGIAVLNSPEGNANAVGQHCLGLLLDMMRNITTVNIEMNRGEWYREKNRGEELDGKTIGIIGYGHTGKAFVEKLCGFNVSILVYDKYKTGISAGRVKMSNYAEIFQEADILSLHLPYTEETHYLANKVFFKSFRKPIYFLNTSRGKICNSEDLLAALANKNVKKAGLDVFENEDIKTMTDGEKSVYNALIDHPNLIHTPHIAGWTKESKYRLAEVLVEKIQAQIELFKKE